MVYQWKIPGIIPVDAQTAGEELERIYKRDGAVSPDAIVKDNADPTAPLHGCFEWDDTKAAHKYRLTQAQTIIRTIVTVCDTPQQTQPVRAFVSVQNNYRPTRIVMEDDGMRNELLATALSELQAFKRKYAALSELSAVFEAIDKLNQ